MTSPKPWRDLTDAEKGALLLAHLEGKRIEHRWADQQGWTPNHDPAWIDPVIYRIAPEPLTPDSINWEHVAPEYNYMARDGSGDTYVFVSRPCRYDRIWDASGDQRNVVGFASYRRGTVDWKDSLVIRPGYEGS